MHERDTYEPTSMRSAPPEVSPDGRFYLDNGRWVPFPVVQTRGSGALYAAEALSSVGVRILYLGLWFPLLGFVLVQAVRDVAPASLDYAASVAVVVVLLGVAYAFVRATSLSKR